LWGKNGEETMILDGKVVAAGIKQRLKEEINGRVDIIGRRPKLVIISVGDDPASKVYVRNKIKAAEEVGIEVKHIVFDDNIKNKCDVITTIWYYNDDDDVDGIMVQLPLPKEWDERSIIDVISPNKDVDGLTTTNIGRLRSGQECLKPCTAAGIIDLLDYYNIALDHQDVTIIGRSNIVGKPLADMMMERGATVTQAHSHTRSLEDALEFADIIVSAVGNPKFLNSKLLSSWTHTIIDVGINRDEDGKLCGDVDYDDVVENFFDRTNITPVPGGVGPMTVAELMKNVVQAWRKKYE
jgi:methylenetetrahydrofolate dehydrogenase (NADP+)/methenyltetrahydrofolate cyclohydrolase